jgi:hypothetical protein
MHATRGRWGVVLSALGLAAVATFGLGGCAIHMQAPIEEVAYDFSDSDFYDRVYAPTPQYRQVGAYDPAHVPAAPLEVAAAFPAEVAAFPAEAERNTVAPDALAAAVSEGDNEQSSAVSLFRVRVPAPDAD